MHVQPELLGTDVGRGGGGQVLEIHFWLSYKYYELVKLRMSLRLSSLHDSEIDRHAFTAVVLSRLGRRGHGEESPFFFVISKTGTLLKHFFV
jgi:hypothetical protein